MALAPVTANGDGIDVDSTVATAGVPVPAPTATDTVVAQLAQPPPVTSLWLRDENTFSRYALRTWGDLLAGRPGSRTDRFGPPGYFETVRIDGTGRPLVLFEGIALPASAGGLPDLNAVPRGGVASISLSTARLLPGAALSAPGGVVEFTPGTWKGGLPHSVVEAEQGPDGASRYRFGFERGIGNRLWVNFDVNVRRADSFVLESFDRREIFFRGGLPLNGGITLEAGKWTSAIDETLFDPLLGSYDGMSHDGSDDRSLAYVKLKKEGAFTARWYTTDLKYAAVPRGEEYAATEGKDERWGGVFSGEKTFPAGRFDGAVRYEKRDARHDGVSRSDGVVSISGAFDTGLGAGIRLHTAVVEEIVERGDAVTGAEVRLSGGGAVEVMAAALRARRAPTLRQWAEGWDSDGVIHRVEAGISFRDLPGKPRFRVFRREVDGERYLFSENGYFDEGLTLDERTTGFEVGTGGTWRDVEGDLSWLVSPVRAKDGGGRLPFQSDHLLRARGTWGTTVPYLGMPGTIDLLGEWRSDRTAPERTGPMDDYYYLRGRVTLDVSGANLYGQIEQITGRSLEYVDAPPPGGGDGALSGTFLVYVGIVWPLED